MAYVKGQNLAELIDSRREPFPIATVLDWGLQLTAVLAYLHGQKPPILFRDLKPSNILLDTANKIRLIDFGIARNFNPEQVTATFLQGVGSAGYSPLEQYQGTGSTDQRSDLYSLGATLYNLLTGEIPPSPVMLITEGRLVQGPSKLNRSIPPALDHIIVKLMALRKDDRYQTVQEVDLHLRKLAESLSQVDQSTEAFDGGPIVVTSVSAPRTPAAAGPATQVQSHRTTQAAPVTLPSGAITAPMPVDPHEKYLWLVIGTISTALVAFLGFLYYKMPTKQSQTGTTAPITTPSPHVTPQSKVTIPPNQKPSQGHRSESTPAPMFTRRIPKKDPAAGTPSNPPPVNHNTHGELPSVDSGTNSVPPTARTSPRILPTPSPPIFVRPTNTGVPITHPEAPVAKETPVVDYNPYAEFKGPKRPDIIPGFAPPMPDGKGGWKPVPGWKPPFDGHPPPIHPGHGGPPGPQGQPQSSGNPYDNKPNGY